MCGRFVDPNLRSEGMDRSWLKISPFPRRYNVKPTQEVYLELAYEPAIARWGLIPSWHRGTLKDWKASSINARIEEVEHKPSYRDPWRFNRCLIPAGGYYEWTRDSSPKQPHYVQSANNEETLWFAGLYSVWKELLTCTIMTRVANEHVSPLHDRMPIILNTEERRAWLEGSLDKGIGAEARVKHHQVRRFGLTDSGPELIEPL